MHAALSLSTLSNEQGGNDLNEACIPARAVRQFAEEAPRAEQGYSTTEPIWSRLVAGMGAGAATCPLQTFISVTDRTHWTQSRDVRTLMTGAKRHVRPLQDRPARVDRKTLARGSGTSVKPASPRRGSGGTPASSRRRCLPCAG